MAQEELIFSSQFVNIYKKSDGYYIESFKSGLSVEEFNKLMANHPHIEISSFLAVKNALLFPPKPLVKFAQHKERIFVEVSSDELKAYVRLCVTPIELAGENKVKLIKEIMDKLKQSGVVFGIKTDVLVSNLVNDKRILVAEGIYPINGQDSVIKMYEMKIPKPEVKEDGKVNHYELNLINMVKAGDWLGERIDPSTGMPGKSVKGNMIPALPGKMYPLQYDKNTVKEQYDKGVTTLFALRNGAVHYDGDKVKISNLLEIVGDVDFKTGNIEFDGYLTVKGTVEDNFSVDALKDIEILGEYGVGCAKEIVSREGSVFIKGGISGKNKTIIRSKKDFYTKYVSDATIICGGTVHIGFYCINSNIIAKEIILDSPKGQIIGGNIQAEIKVVSSIIGSKSENKTLISVKGFDRNGLKVSLERTIGKIEELKNNLARVKQEISIYNTTSVFTIDNKELILKAQEEFNRIRDEMKNYEDERKLLTSALRTRGEGEISILKKAYPGVMLEIKNVLKELNNSIVNSTFYIQDGEIKQG